MASRCYEIARSLSDAALCARARALQGAVSLHRGDLRSALDLLVDAERYAERGDDVVARVEVAALKGQVSFFTGSYGEALSHAERSVQLSDQTGDDDLRIYARRATCLVFGNVGVRDLEERVRGLLAAHDRRRRPLGGDDLAQRPRLLSTRRPATWRRPSARSSERSRWRGTRTAAPQLRHGPRALHPRRHPSARRPPRGGARRCGASDRAAHRQRRGQPLRARRDRARRGPGADGAGPVRRRPAVRRGRADAGSAIASRRSAASSSPPWPPSCAPPAGSRTPTTRSPASAELERQAFRELSELQLSLERATLETSAARLESDELAAKNRELAAGPRRARCFAPTSSRCSRSSCATRPSATGSPACTTAAISPASWSAPPRTGSTRRSPSRCWTSTTSSRSTTASATPPAIRCSCASPGCCSTSCARPTSSCAAAARSSWC